ncbi:MAG: hypothetical protein ACI4HL_00850 [Ruminococcus sp.]
MKDIKEPNFISKSTKKTLLIVVNIILIVALLAISTYAWFFRNLADNVNSEEIQFTAGLTLEVNLEDNEDTYAYSKTIDGFSSSALSKEITGDGVQSHFLYPKLATDETSGLYYPDTTDDTGWTDYSTMTAQSDYIYQRLYFRSSIPVDIYLTNGSYVKSKSETNGKPLISSEQEKLDSDRIVSEPDANNNYYSKDCVVGATRVAFVDPVEKESTLLWIPRPDIFCELNGSGKIVMNAPNTVPNFKNISTLSSVTNLYSEIVPNPGEHWYYTIDTANHKIDTTELASVEENGNFITGTSNLPSVNAVSSKYGYVGTTTKADGSTDEYYRAVIDVAIWVDGCDAEARKQFVGGKFNANFQFVGIGK